MTDFAAWSNLAIVTCTVLYVVALILHAAEWAAARGLHQVAAPAKANAKTKGKVLVSVGTADADTTEDESAPEHDSGPAGEPHERAEQRVDLFGRMAVAVTVIAFVTNLLGMVLRGVAGDRAPWGNMYEFTISAMTFVAAAYLVAALWFKMRWLGLPVTLLAAIGNGLAVTVFFVEVAPLVPALHSVWFIIHIVAAAIAGAAMNIGGLAAILYLVRQRTERKENVRGYLTKLPHSSTLDVVSYRMVAFAFPLWTFAVAAGAVWAEYAWGRFWGWDPKETWALVTWVIYAGYLHARSTAGWRGAPAAWIAVLGLVSFWFNFIGVNLLFSGLHSYAGI